MITAIFRYPVFQRGLYVLHELCKKVLQTLRLRPATVYVQLQMALSLHPLLDTVGVKTRSPET